MKHWLFRPFQRNDIGLVLSTKLLTILQLVAGPTVRTSLLVQEGHFQIGRLLLVAFITFLISLLFSTIWTLDDMGIRYLIPERSGTLNDREIRWYDKPLIFGFYGIVSLLANYSAGRALYSQSSTPISKGAGWGYFRRAN